jgi:ankyrin repeat protein
MNNTIIHNLILENDINSLRKINIEFLINKKNNNGDTPLHLACKNHNLKITELLYRYGASIYIKNNENKTPLDYLNSLESSYIRDLRDRLHGLGKYEYVPRPESKHHGLVSRAYTGMEAI